MMVLFWRGVHWIAESLYIVTAYMTCWTWDRYAEAFAAKRERELLMESRRTCQEVVATDRVPLTKSGNCQGCLAKPWVQAHALMCPFRTMETLTYDGDDSG